MEQLHARGEAAPLNRSHICKLHDGSPQDVATKSDERAKLPHTHCSLFFCSQVGALGHEGGGLRHCGGPAHGRGARPPAERATLFQSLCYPLPFLRPQPGKYRSMVVQMGNYDGFLNRLATFFVPVDLSAREGQHSRRRACRRGSC